MLRGGNPLTVGVGIIIEVIRKNNSDYDPDVGAGLESPPSSRDPIYLGTLLRMFARHVPDFMALILSPTYNVLNEDGTTTVKKRELKAAFGEVIEPLGFDRFKTCELMAELLHCSNMSLLNERGSEQFVRERDRERARRKAEGSLSRPSSPPSALGSGSPEEIRKLEVANGGEEDGFEDVVASDALNDEVKDEFDEKLEPEGEPSSVEQKPKSDSRPDEDDFVDEPLSPQFDSGPTMESSKEIAPLSLTSAAVTAHLGRLDVHREIDTLMGSGPDEARGSDRQISIVVPEENSLLDPTQLPLSNVLDQLVNDHDLRSTGLTVEDLARIKAAEGISPHPEDQPAPLFALRSAESNSSEEAQAGDCSPGQPDSSFGEEAEGSQSVLMTGPDAPYEPRAEMDVDGSPVVGDFLKMMFVEHRVVPTILVRARHPPSSHSCVGPRNEWRGITNVANRTFSSAFPGTTSYTMSCTMWCSRCSMDRWIEDSTARSRQTFSRRGELRNG